MQLNELSPISGSAKNGKRVGRGAGSGTGKTSGRGVKGQKSRSGVAIKGFEGGQMPIYRRLPKRGFNMLSRRRYNELNLDRLQSAIDAKKIDVSKTIDLVVLMNAGMFSKIQSGLKVLAGGTLTTKVSIQAHKASKGAIVAIEKSGGAIEVLEPLLNSKDKAAQRAALSESNS